ncbi:2-dehydro-3-deoxygluconokinase [Pseudarthrobacter sp. W1I19]|uniref:sugar kinase n=1 Tax=Pseudarthrobacter sp. W1I19 TaxID=3042288 RepID=UPI0027839FC9|nr:sugar kinase [Pseudarthrobacter sp. W1I19]MDQ0923874.1 2-dehydro-3-deoxygluconokinase [Pseudarthrobacter sp. W1I19]
MNTGNGQQEASEVVTIGETMALMKAEALGPLSHNAALSLGIGGAESNFAIALQRLGVPVTWAGRVGADSLGDVVLRELRGEGLHLAAVRDPDAPTGLMIKERRTNETQKVWYYRHNSAGSRLSPQDVPATAIATARLLHLTGITPALSVSAAEAVEYAIATARSSDSLVSFDLNYRSALWPPDAAGKYYRRILTDCDVVFAGEEEAALAVGDGTPAQLAQRISDLGPAQVIIKLGAAGSYALIDGTEYRQPAVPISAVDTVGAGDAFVAGYIAELLSGLEVADRLLTAVRTGAFACLVPGDWEGMPRRGEFSLLQAKEPVSR